jgi:hypothetical protein
MADAGSVEHWAPASGKKMAGVLWRWARAVAAMCTRCSRVKPADPSTTRRRAGCRRAPAWLHLHGPRCRASPRGPRRGPSVMPRSGLPGAARRSGTPSQRSATPALRRKATASGPARARARALAAAVAKLKSLNLPVNPDLTDEVQAHWQAECAPARSVPRCVTEGTVGCTTLGRSG